MSGTLLESRQLAMTLQAVKSQMVAKSGKGSLQRYSHLCPPANALHGLAAVPAVPLFAIRVEFDARYKLLRIASAAL